MKARSIKDLAAAVRGRRLDLGMNQSQLARRARVSRKWIVEFETGKPTSEFGLVLRVLDALGLELDVSPTERAGSRTRDTVDLDAILEEHRLR
jgi:HTH-type transcriptional regulator/antitoxin HipB